MSTPILDLDDWAAAQASPWNVENVAKRWLEFFAAGGGITDRDDTAPPGSPVEGEAYLVKATGTGAWAGHDGDIALYMNGAWDFKEAVEGMRLYVKDEDVTIVYDGAAWNTVGGASLAAAAASDIWTGTSTTKAVTPDAMWDAAAYVTLNDSGGNIAVDLSTGINFAMTMDGDYTLSAPSNGKPGQTGVIVFTQDGTGTQTLAYNSAWKFAGGTDPVLSTAAGAVDLLFYQVLANGTDVFGNLVKAVA